MFLSAEQIRFNKSCTEASLGYASAFSAASGVVGNQIFSFWLDAMSPATSPTPSRSSRGKSRAPRAWGESRIVTAREARAERRRRGDAGLRSGVAAGDGNDALAEAMGNWVLMPWQLAGMTGGSFPPNPFGGAGLPFSGLGGQSAGLPFPFGAGAPMSGAINPAAMMSAWLEMDWTRSPESWPMAMGMMSLGVPKTVACPMAEANLAMMNAMNAAMEISRQGFAGHGFLGHGFLGQGFPGQIFPGLGLGEAKPARKPVVGSDSFNGMGGMAPSGDTIAQVQAFQRALFGL